MKSTKMPAATDGSGPTIKDETVDFGKYA